MCRFVVLILGIVSLCSLPMAAKPKDRSWQEGEVTWRKTVTMDHAQSRHEYVYRIRCHDRRYLIVLKQPLHVTLYSPLAFAATRRHVFVRDEDGKEREASILQKSH
jgi:hypothetical protein